jgi:hypothetical protein
MFMHGRLSDISTQAVLFIGGAKTAKKPPGAGSFLRRNMLKYQHG